MQEMMRFQLPLEAMDSKSLHKRSKSDTDKMIEGEETKSSCKPSHHLKLDVEKAKGQTDTNMKPMSDTKTHSSLKQENAKDLIREIAVLELEVMYLEQHLLSLYRKAFDPQISTPIAGNKSKQTVSSQPGLSPNVDRLETSSKRRLPQKLFTKSVNEYPVFGGQEKLTGPGVHRSHSELSYRTVCSARISPSAGSIARALESCHSQPLSFLEDEENSSSRVISLAEYLGTTIAEHIPETPNKLSENMVRCMGAIYHKLAEPPLVHHGRPSSPTSSFSSTSELSPKYMGDIWSPHYKRESTLDARLINPFGVEGLKEFSGPYNTMVEVPLIYRDGRRLSDVKDMLQNYESLFSRLEGVDPRKMKNEEKLAFWINLHNALMMHAYLVYGIPQNNIKRSSLLVKAMCIVGGRSVNVVMIQGYILGCRMHCPGQWLRTFLSMRMKFKSGDEWRAYAIEHPEPLLHFALCSGSHSDPAVRIYTPKKLFRQLEAAKEEYIRATVGIHKEQKILLPKVVDSYAKDVGLSSQQLVHMIQRYLPETLRMAMRRCQQGRSQKIIEWVPHNFSFRYLLSKEFASPQTN